MNNILIDHAVNAVRKTLSTPTAQSGSNRKKRSLGLKSALWAEGQTLRISFFGDTPDEVKSAILNVARQWLEHANLEFEQVDNDNDDAEIRISTDVDETHNDSELGSQSMSLTGPSMYIGCAPGHEQFESIVLRLFGRALGMILEHQHPDANIPWDLDGVRTLIGALMADQGIDPEALDEMVETQLQETFLPQPPSPDERVTLQYDRKSIMHIPVTQELTLGDFEIPLNLALSEKDKEFMRVAYPRR